MIHREVNAFNDHKGKGQKSQLTFKTQPMHSGLVLLDHSIVQNPVNTAGLGVEECTEPPLPSEPPPHSLPPLP